MQVLHKAHQCHSTEFSIISLKRYFSVSKKTLLQNRHLQAEFAGDHMVKDVVK